jgi:hypothetical protein
MTNEIGARQEGASRNLAIVLGLLAVAVASAVAFFASRGHTNAPILELPLANAVIRGTATGATPTFEWRHGYATAANPRPRPVTQFVVCIVAPGQQCSLPGQGVAGQAPRKTWAIPVGSLQRSAATLPPGVVELWAPRFPFSDQPYRYAFTPPEEVPFQSYGRSLRWTAGACSSNTNADCSFAEPRTFRFGQDINLKQSGLSETSVPTRLIADAIAENTGSINSGPFKTVIAIQRIMLQPGSSQVFMDLDSPDFTTEPQVILTNGSKVPRSEAPRDASGAYDWTQIVGIVEHGSQLFEAVEEHPDLLAGAGAARVAHFEFDVTARPARFAIIFKLDVEDAIAETDESDNGYAERSDFFP